jgi:sec-independent protein translocase protein TatC
MSADDDSRKSAPDVDATRMTLGEHLDELRSCVIRSLLALVFACLIFIWPSKYLLAILARPVVLVLQIHGQPNSFLATSPVEAFLVYIKVVLIFALVAAGPYVVYEMWSFIAKGLYPREKAWVHRLVPASVGLFLAGVLFMYFFALPASLNFLVGFNTWLPLPHPRPTFWDRTVLHIEQPPETATQPGTSGPPLVPLLAEDPEHPAPGSVWINGMENRLKVRAADGRTYSVQLSRDDRRAMVTPYFRIGEYLTFVLMLVIAFGAAFQMPLVVLFLARSGLVRVPTLRRYRKVVIMVIVIIAGMLAPPDLLSHLLLSVPMWLLFELGLWLAARQMKKRQAEGKFEIM